MEKTGCLLVSFDFSNGKDKAVMLVGNKAPNKDVVIINAFAGKEAEELYLKLVGIEEDDEKNG